jgi:hypothetical protein
MTSTMPHSLHGTGQAGLAAMAKIEARRFVRHPVFLVGIAAAAALIAVLGFLNDDPANVDVMSWPVVPAFFIGLPSLIVAARLTRSTEVAAEAMAAAPGTEARRTLAVALACVVPFAAGLAWLGAMFVALAVKAPAAQEWWFPTAPDLHVWSSLIALVPVACLGAGLLGVLVGRWWRFPGAAAVATVLLVVVTMFQIPFADGSEGVRSELRLWAPWAMAHSGGLEDGTALLYAGNATFYLGYVLCLCAAAVLAAVWHDRTARTRRLTVAFAGVVVVGLACLALAMTTGIDESRKSEPVPFKVSGS